MHLTIHSKSNQMVTCFVTLPVSSQVVVISYIYAANCKYERRNLWEEIGNLARDPVIASKP